MRAPLRFERSVELEASIDTVFAFHGDPHNVGKISPAYLSAQVETDDPNPRAGGEFKIRLCFFGVLTSQWHGRWCEVEHPNLLVDEALRSPFACWRHHHIFRALSPARTLLTDRVEYRFPGGLLGHWFGLTFGRIQFSLMFANRHARTRRWMCEHG